MQVTFSVKRKKYPFSPFQIFLAMKLTIAMLFFALLQSFASGNPQTVTYSGQNVRLQEVMSAVKKQTGHVFFYRNGDLLKARPVSEDSATLRWKRLWMKFLKISRCLIPLPEIPSYLS